MQSLIKTDDTDIKWKGKTKKKGEGYERCLVMQTNIPSNLQADIEQVRLAPEK